MTIKIILNCSPNLKTFILIASSRNQLFVIQLNIYYFTQKHRHSVVLLVLIVHLLCIYPYKVEVMFVLSPSVLLLVCLCCWGQWSESFLLWDTLACQPDFQWGRGETLACRLKRLSVAGALPGWVIELLSEGALSASHQPFASMALSMGVSIQCY